jgi:ferredoxin, 2Fe-2S
MPRVTYIQADGQRQEVNLEPGISLMQGAVDNMIDGIVAECGGLCSCATCHCYIDETWISQLEVASEMEIDLLDCVSEPKENSRLSCQVTVSESLDGLVVYLPASQF